MANKIYVAISKETGYVITGLKGQAAFSSTGGLNKSMAQRFRYKTVKEGKKAAEYYDILPIDVDKLKEEKNVK